MTLEADRVTAQQFWGDLIRRNPIVAITGVSYDLHPSGIPSNNVPISDHKGMLLEDFLLDKNSDIGLEFSSYRNGFSENKRYVAAFGSLVYIMTLDKKEETDWSMPAKYWAKYLCYEQENHLEDLDYCGILPMAIVMADLDLPANKDNLVDVVSILENDFSTREWTLLETGNSYHLVFDGLVTPNNIPWHYGEIIKKFSPLVAEDQREIFEMIGNCFQKNWKNSEELKKLCKTILNVVVHNNGQGTEDGLSHSVCVRWMAHSILELLEWQKTKEGGFGYLRISAKEENGKMPIVVARHKIV